MKDELVIRWRHADAPEVPIRGAIGGVHPDGTITILFYSEKAGLPDVARHPIEDGQVIWDVVNRDDPADLIRTVHLAGAMSPLVARQIAKWLEEKADEAEATFSAPSPTQPEKEEAL